MQYVKSKVVVMYTMTELDRRKPESTYL